METVAIFSDEQEAQYFVLKSQFNYWAVRKYDLYYIMREI